MPIGRHEKAWKAVQAMVGGAHPTRPAYFTAAAWILEAEPVGSV